MFSIPYQPSTAYAAQLVMYSVSCCGECFRGIDSLACNLPLGFSHLLLFLLLPLFASL